jgi:hypothetical protein
MAVRCWFIHLAPAGMLAERFNAGPLYFRRGSHPLQLQQLQ